MASTVRGNGRGAILLAGLLAAAALVWVAAPALSLDRYTPEPVNFEQAVPEAAELSAREAGGDWSPWVETTDGEPIWTGGSEELQIRSRDSRPHGEIGYVNVSGDATPADRALNGIRGAVNTALVSVAGLFAGDAASADPPFEVVNREEWDPDGACQPRTPVNGSVKAAVIHHTVNANTYAAEEAPGIVLGICRYHRYSHGWND